MQTPQRVLFEEALRSWDSRVRGFVLDVGGGRHPYGPGFTQARALVLDRERFPGVALVADLRDGLPIRAAALDAVLAFNLLEHIATPRELVAEFHRVLVPGGLVLHYTPYLYPVHDDPKDYWRFSPDGLRQLYADFEEVALTPLGGPRSLFLTILHVRRHLYRKYLVPLLFGWARRGDRRDPLREAWASGHLAVWRRP